VLERFLSSLHVRFVHALARLEPRYFGGRRDVHGYSAVLARALETTVALQILTKINRGGRRRGHARSVGERIAWPRIVDTSTAVFSVDTVTTPFTVMAFGTLHCGIEGWEGFVIVEVGR